MNILPGRTENNRFVIGCSVLRFLVHSDPNHTVYENINCVLQTTLLQCVHKEPLVCARLSTACHFRSRSCIRTETSAEAEIQFPNNGA